MILILIFIILNNFILISICQIPNDQWGNPIHRSTWNHNSGCNQQDISGFCIFAKRYKKGFGGNFTRFKELEKILPDGDYDNASPNPTPQIHSYNDLCSLEHAPETNSIENGSPNPYSIKIHEIHVKGKRLHNYLHVTVSNKKGQNKIKYIMLIAHDENAWPIGDFDNSLPCASSCNCKLDKGCYLATHEDSIPCMFTPDHAVTHPSQVWYHNDKGINTFHATWKFTQVAHRHYFKSEIHFKALIIEDTAQRELRRMNPVDTPTGRKHVPSHWGSFWIKKGIFGWTAEYQIVQPTKDSLGAWDYYGKYSSPDVHCHKPINSKYHVLKQYPKYKKGYYPSSTGAGRQIGTQDCIYAFFNNDAQWKLPDRGYYGSIPWKMEGFEGECTRGRFQRIGSKRKDQDEALRDIAKKHRKRMEPMARHDRCRCPAHGNENPYDDVPPEIQMQGRRLHAIQMCIVWIWLIPFGMFVARYYKETFSKVFFFEEYWWYTMHVIFFFIAIIIIIGSIVAIEMKRVREFNFKNKILLAHLIIGVIAIVFFVLHFCFGFVRITEIRGRKINIFLHWLFGLIEYILGIIAIFLMTFVRRGMVPCSVLVLLFVFLFIQCVIYLVMEIHMRKVDKELNLDPKRSYLPPPVMRVFDKNAPGYKFRMIMFIVYAGICMLFVLLIYIFIVLNHFRHQDKSCLEYVPENNPEYGEYEEDVDLEYDYEDAQRYNPDNY